MADTVPEIAVTGPQLVTFWPGKRYLGPITALMFIDERGVDRLTITKHPVEYGASITDHAYMEPAELTLRLMATNSVPAALSFASGGSGGTPGPPDQPGYVENIYTKLRKLQSDRITFPVQTGKRLYENMLMTSLELTTDEKSENALMLTVVCTEIIKVSTGTVTASADVMAQAQKTGPVEAGGTKQPTLSTAQVAATAASIKVP